MFSEREEWLNETIEEPLEPFLPICDPHHHLWYGTENDYPIEALLRDISGGHRIRKTVFVESSLMFNEKASPEMQPVGETEFVGNLLRSKQESEMDTEIAAGIIGFADLTLGAKVAPVLEAHIAAERQRFRGIRHTAAWDASPEVHSRRNTPPSLLMDRNFRRGFATLQRYNLSFDAWIYHPQLDELTDLAREFPDTSIILNHVGGPLRIGPYASKLESAFREWQRSINELAACDNVSVKLGGLGMRISGNNWDKAEKPPSSTELAKAFEPYITWCIECFGVDRCMFESNFPVDKASYSYTILWNAFKRLTENLAQEDRLALFYNTALKVYRLDD